MTRYCAPPPFTVLVAHVVSGTDPSRPEKLRTGFVLQHFHDPNGRTVGGGPLAGRPALSTTNATASIQVAPHYWDPAGAESVPPYGPKDEIRVNSYYLVAGEDFGVGMGSGTDTAATALAVDLGSALMKLPGVEVLVASDRVYLRAKDGEPELVVAATNDYSAIEGTASFTVRDGAGNVQTTVPNLRRSVAIPNPPDLASPEILRR